MSFLDSSVVEKVKPTLASITSMIFGTDAKARTNSKNAPELNVFDKFSKKKAEDTIYTPVSKKVWVNGKEYALMGQSQQELEEKIKRISQDRIQSTANIINPEKVLFASLYSEKVTIEKNEWSEKSDVWINEYCPN